MKYKQVWFFVLPGILLALVLAVMRWYGDSNGLFVQSLWYDKIMHTLGGSGACILTCLMVFNLRPHWRSAILRLGFPLIGRVSGLFFGVAWEALEAIFPIITEYIPQGQWDTGFDLAFDYVGGHIAGRIYEGRFSKHGGEE